jgi:acyl carrier protein
MSIEQRVYGVLINLLGDTNLSINIDANLELDTIPKMDSLFFLEMISDFEKEFKVKFNLEDLIGQKKVGDFIDIIKTLVGDGL